MIIGVLKEASPESRVSLLPEHIQMLKKWGVSTIVEEGAGSLAYNTDEMYRQAEATIASRTDVISKADILLSINIPKEHSSFKAKILLGLFQPLFRLDEMNSLSDNNNTVFSIDMLPRTTRAQPMDVLSSQANIAGYKAVLLASVLFPRYFPMFMTAAGSIAPAKVLILGAGVAGLQAIATARRLGAIVEVFDTRPAVKEEVMSLGAKFVEVEGAADAVSAGGYAVEQTAEFIEKQKDRIAQSVAKSDIIITTAQIPGKKAPVLITQAMINTMKHGSVIIDLAAATGGNTEFTKADETIDHNGVRIVAAANLPSAMPLDASRLYGKNIVNFLRLIIDNEGNLNLNFQDDLVTGTCISHEGKIINPRINSLITQPIAT